MDCRFRDNPKRRDGWVWCSRWSNSFVNQDVPNFAIVAGSPARVIRYRFSKDMQEIILDSLWWDHDIEEARQILAQLEKLPELGQHLWLGI